MPVPAVVNGALGTKLRHGVTVSMVTTYTEVAQVVSIGGIPRTVGTRNTSNLDSTVETFAATLVKNGEMDFEAEYDPQSDSHQILELAIASPPAAPIPWQVLFQDTVNGTSTATFLGILTEWSPTGIEREANLLANGKIQISGPVVVAKGV